MLICLFGGVAAFDDHGNTVDVGAQKCQAVLASLALSAGEAVPVARLVDRVWGDEPPLTAEKTLQSYITRLRKGLGGDSITRVGAAYRLNVEPASVDILRFQRLVRAGDIGEALVEWNGTPLAGLDAPGLDAVVDGLVEQWLGAVETDLGQRVEVDPSSVIGALTELSASYPFREGIWALLMTALYRVGRQADALAAYRAAREHLVGQLGVEPGPRLRELESRILDQDEDLGIATVPAPSATDIPSGMVTIAFCDVEDSVRLWASQRTEMALAMARHDELVRVVVAKHAGYIFSTGGDQFGVAFRLVSDAVSWAHDLQSVVAAEPWPATIQLRVRIGLHIGEPDERGGDYFGPVVNVAARMSAAGHGGQTLASAAIASLIDERGTRDLGSFWMKGLLTEQRVFQLDTGTHPRLRTAGSERGNLPRRLNRLIGRERELAAAAKALAAAAVVTLLGPGGIGKTRLAIAVASAEHLQAPNEAWIVDLATVTSSTEVPRAVAEVLGVSETSPADVTRSVAAFLQPRADLIVLDNCEHVIDGAARFAQSIAEHCPDTQILATSREGLGVAGEQILIVGPLEPDEAGAELFAERALAASADFDPVASRPHVEDICRRLDGVPLAIELAASRISRFTPAEMIERLDDHLRLLTGGRRTSVERHRTLRATLQWSYDLLSDDERTVFERLGVFAGGFDLEGAHQIIDDGHHDADNLEELLGDLADRSMLLIESGRFGRRFRLLETMRQFAIEQLAATGDTNLVAQRHAKWCLDVAVDVGRRLEGRGEIEGVARLNEHWTNLRAAVNWSLDSGDHRLAFGLVRPVATEVAFRSRSEIGDWFEQILSITPPDDVETIVLSLLFVAQRLSIARNVDRFEQIVDAHREIDHPALHFACAVAANNDDAILAAAPAATAALRAQGDHHLALFVEMNALSGLLALGRFDDVHSHATPLVDRFIEHGPPTMLSWTLFMHGLAAELSGHREQSDRLADEAAQVAVPEGTLPINAPMEARAALRRGDRRSAIEILRRHLDDLTASDALGVVRLACMPFIEVVVDADQHRDAAIVLRFLEASGSFGSLTLRTLDSDIAATITATAGRVDTNFSGSTADARIVITHMTEVLRRLIDEPNAVEQGRANDDPTQPRHHRH